MSAGLVLSPSAISGDVKTVSEGCDIVPSISSHCLKAEKIPANLSLHAFFPTLDKSHVHQTGENDHLWECEQWEMRRNEQGHDSPVFEAVSGLELSSNLKFYPSSGRGRLTHTAHIKASILCTHTHTHTNKHSDKEQRQCDLADSTENQILCLTKSTICSFASPACFSQVLADNCFCIKDLPNHSSTLCQNWGVLRGT